MVSVGKFLDDGFGAIIGGFRHSFITFHTAVPGSVPTSGYGIGTGCSNLTLLLFKIILIGG